MNIKKIFIGTQTKKEVIKDILISVAIPLVGFVFLCWLFSGCSYDPCGCEIGRKEEQQEDRGSQRESKKDNDSRDNGGDNPHISGASTVYYSGNIF